jgi:hypothetical protein
MNRPSSWLDVGDVATPAVVLLTRKLNKTVNSRGNALYSMAQITMSRSGI